MSIVKYLSPAIVAAFALTSCSEPETTDPELPARPTKLLTIQTTTEPELIRLPAVIEAADHSTLTFQVPGLLSQMTLVEGDPVTKGDILGKLDQRDFRNSVSSAEAAFTQADGEYQRAARLLESDAIAESVVEQRQAQRQTARAMLDSARKRLEDTELRAPFDGIIADVHVEQFEAISPQQPIVTVQTSQAADVVVQVPASIVINADTVTPTDIELELDAAPDILIPVTLKESVARADPGTQTYEVRFSLSPPDGLLILPGMTGILSAQIPVQSKGPNLDVAVPISAVLSEAGQTYVWIVNTNEMVVNRRDVSVRTGNGVDLIVESGLEAGDTIVGAGGQYLFEGATIRAYAG